MTVRSDITAGLAFNTQSLDRLKLEAKRNPTEAVGALAKEFETLFLSMILKSMREATPNDSLFDSEQTRLYMGMLDQQLAQHMAARGMGLSEVMARQLARYAPPGKADPNGSDAPAINPSPVRPPILPDAGGNAGAVRVPSSVGPNATSPAPAPLPLEHTREFVNRVWKHATEAARAVGIQPHFIVGQAALETGWGRHEMRTADGTPSHNLFGIKAGREWNGPIVEKTTTEYVDGVAQTTVAKFRVYESYADSFRDYARLLLSQPRYAGVLNQAQDAVGFARGLQQAGYATDPAYGDKLVRIITGETLRRSLSGEPPVQV